MHLAINSGTDLVLFNAWLTYIADKGWTDKAFIDGLDQGFRQGASPPTRPASKMRRGSPA